MIRTTLIVFGISTMCFFAPPALADTAGLVDGMWFSQSTPTDAAPVTVYAVVRNQTGEPLSGIATLHVDGEAARAHEVKVSSKNIERIALQHQFSVGTHTVRITFTPTNTTTVDQTTLASRSVTVYADTDADGTPNIHDDDDDNDGIADEDDGEPLTPAPKEPAPSLSEQGKEVLTNLTGRLTGSSSEQQSEEVKGEEEEASDGGFIASIESARKRGAEAVREYEHEQREALAKIDEERAALPSVEGFEPTAQEEGERRSHQIAAAGAAVTGAVLEHGFLFYGHIAILGASIVHVGWGFIRRRFEDDETEEDEEEEE